MRSQYRSETVRTVCPCDDLDIVGVMLCKLASYNLNHCLKPESLLTYCRYFFHSKWVSLRPHNWFIVWVNCHFSWNHWDWKRKNWSIYHMPFTILFDLVGHQTRKQLDSLQWSLFLRFHVTTGFYWVLPVTILGMCWANERGRYTTLSLESPYPEWSLSPQWKLLKIGCSQNQCEMWSSSSQ